MSATHTRLGAATASIGGCSPDIESRCDDVVLPAPGGPTTHVAALLMRRRSKTALHDQFTKQFARDPRYARYFVRALATLAPDAAHPMCDAAYGLVATFCYSY